MREWSFGRASSIAMNDPFSFPKKWNAAEGFNWLFEGEQVAIYDGVPAQSGMKYLHLTDDYPYPTVEIGSKEMVFDSLQNGKCVLSPSSTVINEMTVALLCRCTLRCPAIPSLRLGTGMAGPSLGSSA